jgi:ribosome-binding factor A
MPRDFPRKLRVAAEVQRVLNTVLSGEVKDPRLIGVTISAVDLSGDVSVAKVSFSTLNPDDDSEVAAEGLRKAGGFMRWRLGQILSMRRIPELRFDHDEGARYGLELRRLIDEVVAKDRDVTDSTDTIDD